MDTTPPKTLSLRINLETPASSILPENPLDSLHNVLEKLASKRRTASDNLFPLQNQNQEDHNKNDFSRRTDSSFLPRIPKPPKSPYFPQKLRKKPSSHTEDQFSLAFEGGGVGGGWSTGITESQMLTKQTEEDFESDEISEEKGGELSEGVIYGQGGVGRKEESRGEKGMLENIVKDIQMRKNNYKERELFFKSQKTHEKSLSENVFTTFLPLDPEHQNVKNMIGSPFVPNFAPKKLDSIDEGTKSLFKKHLEKIKGKKRETRSDDLREEGGRF